MRVVEGAAEAVAFGKAEEVELAVSRLELVRAPEALAQAAGDGAKGSRAPPVSTPFAVARLRSCTAASTLDDRKPSMAPPSSPSTVASSESPLVPRCDFTLDSAFYLMRFFSSAVIFPSDHFVHPEDSFIDVVEQAVWAAEWMADRIILLGVEPDGWELDYGWIQPGETLAWSAGHRVRGVQAFIEKPTSMEAARAMGTGALWNTLVLAAKVQTLWKLGWRYFPEMMPLFERLG